MKQKSVLIVLTGGTISMTQDPETRALRPASMEEFKQLVPELNAPDIHVDMLSFSPLIDSSDVNSEIWKRLAEIVYNYYTKYDGFVILHGTDTMAFSASALSFMLEDLNKPVVFTGSQLPVGVRCVKPCLMLTLSDMDLVGMKIRVHAFYSHCSSLSSSR